ncbi:MAG: DUF3014 domain-containing protein [Gammaproteobacteria bacterium]
MGRYDVFEQPKKSRFAMLAILILLIALAAGAYYLYENLKPDDIASKSQTEKLLQIPKIQETETHSAGEGTGEESVAPETEETDPRGKEEVPDRPVLPLPALEQSDSAIREELIGLSSGLAEWLEFDDIIRKYLTAINDFSQGQRPYKHFNFLVHKEPFKAKKDEQGLYIDPEGYGRYDGFAQAVDQMDAEAAIALYQRYKPLLRQVFEEFGYPRDHQIDDIVRKAIAKILEAPVLEDRIGLVRPSVSYKFADENLESLGPVQKQMIRMGPRNTVTIQNKLREFIQTLSRREQ